MEDDIAAVAAPLPSYEVAKNLFLAELPPDQKEVFKATTLDNIFSQAKSTFQKRVDENHVLRAQRKLKPLIDCLEGYGQAMDTLSQTSTLILCPIWGSIRVVLHAAQQYEKYYDKIVDMYARIGDNLPRFLVYEHLFRSHNRVLTALTEAYLDIIRFSTEAIKIFQDSKEAGGSALYRPTHFLKRRWAQFDDRFDAYITSFHRHQTQVAEEAKVAHFIEAKKSQELELASRELQKRTVRTDQRRKTLALLSGINYREMHGRVRKLRHEGTGAWLTDDYDFRAWLDEKFSNSYCIFGIPGSGKTVLASAVIDAISPLYLEASTVLAFHYCYYADRATLTPRNLFGNISRQILDRVDLMFPGVEKLTRSAVDSGFPLSTEDTLSVLLDALRYFSKVFLVWDGLDELAAEDQKIVVEAIPKILAASANVKLVILCRREEHYLRLALQSYPSVEITSGDNSADISLYVNSMVETKIAEGELLIESEALKEEVIERLIVGAKDMFLWVRFQLEELCEALNETEIRTKLGDLPRDLADTYGRIVEKVYKSKDGKQKLARARKLFQWIITARRPMTAAELGEALALEVGDRTLDQQRVPANTSRMLECCANLIVYDRHDNTVRLAHHTVMEFLHRMDHPLLQQTDLALEKGEAAAYVGDLCATYLSMDDFETQLVRAADATSTMKTSIPAAQHAMWSHVPLGNMATKLASVFGRSNRPESHFTLKVPARMEKKDFSKRYALLKYVSANWAWHTTHCLDAERESNGSYSQFLDLTFHRRLPFDFRPWIDGIEAAPTDGRAQSQNMFYWAINQDLPLFLKMLRRSPYGDLTKQYLTQREADTKPLNTFVTSLVTNSPQVFRYFLDSGIGFNMWRYTVTPSYWAKAIEHVACNYNYEDFSLFLRLMVPTKAKGVELSLNPVLCECARIGNANGVRNLLKMKATPSIRFQNPAYPDVSLYAIEWALVSEDADTIHALMDHELDDPPRTLVIAFIIALHKNQHDILRLLHGFFETGDQLTMTLEEAWYSESPDPISLILSTLRLVDDSNMPPGILFQEHIDQVYAGKPREYLSLLRALAAGLTSSPKLSVETLLYKLLHAHPPGFDLMAAITAHLLPRPSTAAPDPAGNNAFHLALALGDAEDLEDVCEALGRPERDLRFLLFQPNAAGITPLETATWRDDGAWLMALLKGLKGWEPQVCGKSVARVLHKVVDIVVEKEEWLGFVDANKAQMVLAMKEAVPRFNDPVLGKELMERLEDLVVVEVAKEEEKKEEEKKEEEKKEEEKKEEEEEKVEEEDKRIVEKKKVVPGGWEEDDTGDPDWGGGGKWKA